VSFTIIYDRRDPEALASARRHRGLWGVLYTSIDPIDETHVALTFRPAPNRKRWRAWERVRKSWILEELEAA